MNAPRRIRSRIDNDGRECTSCQTYKVWDEFYKMKHGRNGYRAQCKDCVCAEQRVRDAERR